MRFIEKLNTLRAVVAVVAVFLVVDGFLFYRYQQRLATAENDTATQPAAEIDDAPEETAATTQRSAASENATERTDGAEAFVHRAAPETVVENSTYVNHPLADGNPNAVLLVERVSQPGGEPDDVHNVGVWYDASSGVGEWAVFNQDRAPMAEGTAFDLAVREGADGDAFVHRAAPENIVYDRTYVDHPSTNANPNAVLSVTQNWNPGGGAGTYNDHPVEVRYDLYAGGWAIFNQDLAAVPDGAAFNVAITGGAATER